MIVLVKHPSIDTINILLLLFVGTVLLFLYIRHRQRFKVQADNQGKYQNHSFAQKTSDYHYNSFRFMDWKCYQKVTDILV